MSSLDTQAPVLTETKVSDELGSCNYMARDCYLGLFLMHWINKFVFLASVYFTGVINGNFSRARLIHRAINAGEIMAANEVSQK